MDNDADDGPRARARVDAPLPSLPPAPPAKSQGPLPAPPATSTTRSAASSMGTNRLQAYTALLSADNLLPGHAIADLYLLRHLSIQGGVPDSPSWLRPQAWRVLLGYLPPEKRDWSQTLAARRLEYARFLIDFLGPLDAGSVQGSSQASQASVMPERDVLLDQLYKDIIRSRKNGFAFYHAGVDYSAQDTAPSSMQRDSTQESALGVRQALLHRLRKLNRDYAAVTDAELEQASDTSMVRTPTIKMSRSLPVSSEEESRATPTIVLPATDSLPPVQEPSQSFEALFNPAQHVSTPAGDAPAPFAADAVALPPPASLPQSADLTGGLDGPSSGSGALRLDVDTAQGGASSAPGSPLISKSERSPDLLLSPPSPSSTTASSTASFASVAETSSDTSTGVDDLSSDAPGAVETSGSADDGPSLDESTVSPQQAMLDARKALQDEISESQAQVADKDFTSSTNGTTAPQSTQTDGTGSASRTPLASAMALPPANAVEGYSSSPLAAPPQVVAPPAGADLGVRRQLRDRRWHAILRILYVYAVLNPSVGYVQGLNEIAFVIYWVMAQTRSSSRAGRAAHLNVPGTPTTPRVQSQASGDSQVSAGVMDLSPRTPQTDSFLTEVDQDESQGNNDGSSAPTELDLEADAFWCFSLLVGSVRELYEFDGIDHAAAGLSIRNARQGSAAGRDLGNEGPAVASGWAKGESGMAGALRRLSLRLRWVDEPLWLALRRASLDPRLPYYSFRWLACLLSNELALPSVVRLWDTLLAEQDTTGAAASGPITSGNGAASGLAESSKVEFLIDICAALLVRLREPLMRPPPPPSRRTRARRQRTIRRRTPSGRQTEDTDSDAPSVDEDDEDEQAHSYTSQDYAEDDFAYKMHILQTFPDALDLDVDVGPVLEQAYLFRQRRLTAELTGDGPPTVDDEDEELDNSSVAPTLQSLGQRASSAWRDWRVKATPDTSVDASTLAEPGSSTSTARSPSTWLTSFGSRFASAQSTSTDKVADTEQASPATRRIGESFQRYADALQSSDAAANLSKASTNLTAKALAMSASWSSRSQPQSSDAGGHSATPPSSAPAWTSTFASAGRGNSLGTAPSSLFAKARSVSAAYMASMTSPNGDARRPSVSGGEDSDSSYGQHPTRWSRVPIPNFPLPDPNDSDGRKEGSPMYPSRGGSGTHLYRPQSPDGSEAGSESSSARRMLPSLRMAAQLGLLPTDSPSPSGRPSVSGGPRPLMLSSSARPPRDYLSSRELTADMSSDLEMSRKVSSGPMAANAASAAAASNGTGSDSHHSPASSPRDSVSSANPRAARSYMHASSRRPRGGFGQGHDSSRTGSESGGEIQTISSPPSEGGSGSSRPSSLVPIGAGNGSVSGARGSTASTVVSSARISGSTLNDDVSSTKDGQTSGQHKVREGSLASLDSITTGSGAATQPTPPSAWRRPITSNSDVPLVRSVDASLRSHQRRRRQDTGSSLESTSVTPTDARGSGPPGSEPEVGTATATGDNLVRYQLSDEPVAAALDRSADTVIGESQSTASAATASITIPSTEARSRFRSRVGSTRSLGKGVQPKQESTQASEEGEDVAFVPASQVLGAERALPDGDGLDDTTLDTEDDVYGGQQDADNSTVAFRQPTSSELMSPLDPSRGQRRATPHGLSIDTGKARTLGGSLGKLGVGLDAYGNSASPSPLPSPGPEAGMFVSADSLLAELGAELEGFSPPGTAESASTSPLTVDRRLRNGKESSDSSDWAFTPSSASAPTAALASKDGVAGVDSGGLSRRRTVRLSEEVVPEGTLDEIGTAFTQLEED